MKYPDDFINKVIQGDCLEFMKQMPDKSVDLVLTDPPYGIGMDKGTDGFGTVKGRKYLDEWDDETPTKEVLDEVLRIGKNVIIFGGNFFADKLPTSGHWIVWDKKGDIEFNNPFGDCELAWTNLNKKSIKKYKVIQQGFVSEERIRWHPTQKPVKLFLKIINDYCIEGGVVMDCFLGSGTTAVAAKQLKRNFIGIEKEENYCQISRSRLRQEFLF